MDRVSRTAWSRVRLPVCPTKEPSSGLGQGVRSKEEMSCYLYISRSLVDGNTLKGALVEKHCGSNSDG